MRISKLLLAALCYTPMLMASDSKEPSLLEEIVDGNSSAKTFISKPFLIFRENKVDEKNVRCNSEGKVDWNVDVIVATENLPDSTTLTFEMNGSSLAPDVLYCEPGNDKLKSKKFFKTSFSLPRKDKQYGQPYSFKVDGTETLQRTIAVPGLKQELHFITTSCNGFTKPDDEKLIGSKKRLWSQILAQHKKRPNHLMIGLGDQLYCDTVFNLPELQPWLSKKFDIEEFTAYAPIEETKVAIETAIDQYYFHHYLEEFSKNTPSFSECLGSIPQINIWDDHDIFDGYGSLPALLQSSPMVKMIGSIAKKYYLLFQHGVKSEIKIKKAIKLGFLSDSNYSFFKVIGSTTFMAMDTRSERNAEHVMAPGSFTKLLEENLPKYITPSTKHLFILSGTPIIYPNQRLYDMLYDLLYDAVWFFTDPYSCKTLTWRRFAQWAGNKIGVQDVLGSVFADASPDGWCGHKDEKTALMEALDRTCAKNVRAVILTGDVHCGGIARVEKADNSFNHIWQFTTSPVGNIPIVYSSQFIAKYIEDKAAKNNNSNKSKERFLKWQKDESAPYFIQRRNWLSVDIKADASIEAQLNTEIPNSEPPRFETFEEIVPPVSTSMLEYK